MLVFDLVVVRAGIDCPATLGRRSCCCSSGCDDFVRFLVCIMSEMEISFYWMRSCMFGDMRSVFCVDWGGKPLEPEP